MDEIYLIIWSILLLLIYILPGIIARRQKKENADAIFILNLLLGWTYVGWVIALVWALMKDKKETCKTV